MFETLKENLVSNTIADEALSARQEITQIQEAIKKVSFNERRELSKRYHVQANLTKVLSSLDRIYRFSRSGA